MQAIDPSAGFAPVPAVLIVRQGRSPGQQLPVTKTPVTLGRDAANDLAINDPQISRRHASLSWDGLHWILQDLGSANGTYVNGVRISPLRVLQDGDIVGLGTGVMLSFQVRSEESGQAVTGAKPPSRLQSTVSPLTERRGQRSLVVPLLVAVLMLGCLLAAGLGTFLLWPQVAGQPDAPPDTVQRMEWVEVSSEPPAEETLPPPSPGGAQVAVGTDAGAEDGEPEASPPPASLPVVSSSPESLIRPEDLVYRGAFRLPDDGEPPRTFEYGGNAMTFNPDGDLTSADPYRGSLFITGHDRVAYGGLPDGDQVAEVSIPAPAIADNPAGLPQAAFIQGFHDVTAGYFTEIEEIPKVGMQYLNHPATGPKVHLGWGQHLQLPDAPSHAWFNPTLGTPDLQGVWFIGHQDLYSTNGYMFDIPTSWADTYAQSRYLATGRMRDGGQGGMGPTLFAYRPWLPDGLAPPSGTHLEETTLLLYENVYNTPDLVRCLEGYQHADEWEGGAWMTTPSGKGAVLFAGTKSTGTKSWYGYINPLGPEYPCVDQHVTDFDTCRMADGSSCPAQDYAGCCDEEQETCVSYRGWWSTRFDAQFILYDPVDLARVAAGAIESWEPQPYAAVDIDEHLYLDPPEWDQVNLGWDVQRRNRIGPAAYDRNNALLYVLEMSADGAKPVVHVWKVTG